MWKVKNAVVGIFDPKGKKKAKKDPQPLVNESTIK